jgi:hypothetical protein
MTVRVECQFGWNDSEERDMKDREKTVLALVVAGGVLVIAALIFFLGGGNGEPEDSPISEDGPGRAEEGSLLQADITGESGSEPGGREALDRVTLDGAAPGAVEEEEEGLAIGEGTISGSVLAEQAGGIAGARVVFSKDREAGDFFFDFDFVSGETKDRSRMERAVETGPDGRFSIKRLPAVANASLLVTHENFVAKRIPLGEFGGGKKDVGVISLELGGTISGMVRSADGRIPVEGALVQATKKETSMGGGFIVWGGDFTPGRSVKATTDKDGYYVLHGVPAGQVDLKTRHADHPSSKRRTVKVVKGRIQSGVDFLLEPGCAIAGVVTDEAGNPLGGIRVTASSDATRSTFDFMTIAGWSQRAKTDENGAFTVNGLSEGTYKLKAAGRIYPEGSVSGVKTGTTDVSLVLKKGGVLFGHVTSTRTDAGVKGLDFKVKQGRFNRSFAGTVLTGAEAARRIGDDCAVDGAYFIEGTGSAALSITIRAKGFADREFSGITADSGDRKEENFSLLPEACLSGVLLGPEETPFAEGTLTLKERKEEGASSEGGTFVRSRSISVSGDGESVDFGRGGWSKKVKSSEDGRFLFRGVPEGDYTLTATHEDHPPSDAMEISLAEGESQTGVEIQLTAGGGIAGTVFGEDQLPLPGARVFADKVKPGESRARLHDLFGGGGERATADINGNYEFKGLAPGEYKVGLGEEEAGAVMMSVVIDGQNDDDSRQSVIVREGETIEFDIYDIPGGEINGFVTEAGKGVEGVTVELFPAEGLSFMPIKSASTDGQGGYVMADVKPGDYRVRLALPGAPETIEETVSLSPAGQAVQNFDLPTGRVSGTILDAATGEPVPGIAIRMKPVEEKKTGVRQERAIVSTAIFATAAAVGDEGESVSSITIGGGSKTVKTDENGFFEIRHLEEGEYRLVADGKGYIEGSIEPIIVREAKETRDQNLTISRGNVVEGKLVDADTGKTVSFCPVRCVKLNRDGEPENGGPQVTVSGTDGVFRFKGLIGGEYRITCDDGDYEGGRDIRVRESLEATKLVLEVRPSP